jgi:hypothetical protein
MKKLIALAVLTVASPAFAGKQDFTVVNRTGYQIDKIFVAPSKSNDWEEDVMGDDVMEDGTSQPITFESGTSTCKYDLKAVYNDGDSAEWGNIDLCTVSKVTLHYNAKTDTTSADIE